MPPDSPRSAIVSGIKQLLQEQNLTFDKTLEDDTLLFDTGLDSLGFAILIARLEQELGYDPFVLCEEAVYPRTFGEFVAMYEKYKDHAK